MAEALTAAPITGKRKTAVARIRLRLGTGLIVVNGRAIDEYFGRETLRTLVKQPLDAANATTRYDIAASVKGGGPTGQAGALRHGIARALCSLDEGIRPTLKQGRLLDARRAQEGAQEVRTARCARALPVLEALIHSSATTTPYDGRSSDLPSSSWV